MPITPVRLPRRGKSQWVLLQAPWKKDSLTNLLQQKNLNARDPGGVWHDDVWLGWSVGERVPEADTSMSKCCQVDETLTERHEDNVSVASTSVGDQDETASSADPELASA